VHDVILPAENRTNVAEDLTPEQLEGVNIHYVSTIEEALSIALPSSAAEERSDEREREAALTRVGA
jgi:ATP-dependent Lon protease